MPKNKHLHFLIDNCPQKGKSSKMTITVTRLMMLRVADLATEWQDCVTELADADQNVVDATTRANVARRKEILARQRFIRVMTSPEKTIKPKQPTEKSPLTDTRVPLRWRIAFYLVRCPEPNIEHISKTLWPGESNLANLRHRVFQHLWKLKRLEVLRFVGNGYYDVNVDALREQCPSRFYSLAEIYQSAAE